MPKHKTAAGCKISGWLSARADNKDGRFIQVGNSLLLSSEYQALTPSARFLYMCMAMECAGKRDFEFTKSAAKKYGIPAATLRRCVNELEKAEFISFVTGANIRAPNKYRFEFGWKLTE